MKKGTFLRLLALFGILLVLLFYGENNQQELNTATFISITVIVILVLMYNKEDPFNLFYVFICAVGVFHFSQMFLNMLGLPVNKRFGYDIYSIYSKNDINTTVLLCMRAFLMICIGGLVAADQNRKHIVVTYDDNDLNRTYRFGKTLFWVLVIPVIIYDVTLLRSALTLGYKAKTTFSNVFLTTVDAYFPFSIICIISGRVNNRNWKKYYYFALLRIGLQMLLVGNRGPLMICLIMYEFAKKAFPVNSEKRKKIPITQILAIGLLFCIGLSYVAVIRGGNRVSITEFFAEYNPITLFFSEFGSTLVTPILANQYVRINGDLGGMGFLGAIAIILPLSTYYLGNIRNLSNVAAILNSFSPTASALGGSIFSDLIMNFSNPLVQIMTAFGIGIGVMKVSNRINDRGQVAILRCIMIFCCYGIVWYARGTAQEFILAFKRALYIGILYYLYTKIEKMRGIE